MGDETVVKEMLGQLNIPQNSVEIIQQSPNGQDLIDGKVACATAMSYNEHWQILDKGIPSTDLIVINPEMFGIPHIEDGLYVMTDRLSSSIFREQLVKLTKALRTGWVEARIAPTLAVETVVRIAPKLSKDHQQHMLESVLGVIPSNPDQFGLFDLGRYKSEVNRLFSPGRLNPTPERIWTYDIWNELKKEDKNTTPLAQATKFYVSSTTSMLAFKILVYFGVFTYALLGA